MTVFSSTSIVTIVGGGPNQDFREKIAQRLTLTLNTLDEKNFDIIKEYYTEDGFLTLQDLVLKTNFKALYSHYRSTIIDLPDGNYEVRDIKVRTNYKIADHDTFEYLVFTINNFGLISNVRFALESEHYKSILEQGLKLKDFSIRQKILNFLEIYQTAFNCKDLNYLEKLFDDDALIIMGRVDSSESTFSKKVGFVRFNKEQYIDRLKKVFSTSEFINVSFYNIEIIQHPRYHEIYGITFQQTWNSSTYSDVGYLFLMLDFINMERPILRVISWQPNAFDDGSVVGLYDFQIMGDEAQSKIALEDNDKIRIVYDEDYIRIYGEAAPDGSIEISYNAFDLNKIKQKIDESKYKGELKSLPEIMKEVFGKSRSWAVIIGINNYSKVSNGYDSLPFSIRDSKAVINYLINELDFSKDHVIALYNRQATKKNIEYLLGDDLPKKLTEKDRLLVYFSGHGETVNTSSGKEYGYLIPADGNRESLHSSCISMSQIEDFSDLIPAKQLLFVIDACYSGIAGIINKGDKEKLSMVTRAQIEKFIKSRGRQILTAGSSKERAVMDKKWNDHSVFTYYFLKGLKGEADYNSDLVISAKELELYVSEIVSKETNGKQNPRLYDLDDTEGQFIFYRQGDVK